MHTHAARPFLFRLPAPRPAKVGRKVTTARTARVGNRDCTRCQVRQLAVCQGFSPANPGVLQDVTSEVRLRAGQLLASAGEPRLSVYTVASGALRRIRVLADGRRLVAGFLMPGDFIGFSGASHYRHSLESIGPSVLCAVSQTDLRALCTAHPALERLLLERACLELDATRDKLMALARMTPIERLAGFLLDMAERRRRQGQHDDRLELPMTRADIADYLGLTVETVSRTFTRLRSEGLISSSDAHHIQLLQPARLRCLADAVA